MHRSHFHPRRFMSAALAVAGVAAITGFPGTTSAPTASATSASRIGIVCTYGSEGKDAATQTFDLETDADYINLPDGNTAYMYGYKVAGHHFQHPSPVLCVKEGATVTVTLHNTLPRDTSIMFPGQSGVMADGRPATPQFDGSNQLTSLTQTAPASNGSVTYTFTADHPGTFLYESGTDPDVQVRMGLFGALIVRPTQGDDFAYDRPDSRFTTLAGGVSPGARNDEEYLVLLSEVDPYLNQAIEAADSGRSSNYTLDNYHPRYWLINGRGFPDSIADNDAAWLPNQPYGSMAAVTPMDGPGQDNQHPLPGLARYLNVGTENYPFHPHGNNGRVVGRDGQPLESATGEDMSYEKFAIDIGPGQTYDVLFGWYDAEDYSAANPVPVEVPQVANQVFGMFYSGSPYLGELGAQPPGNQSLNQCGEYYIISHNHALYQITSWGVTMTGPITYMRIDTTKGATPSSSTPSSCN